MDTPDGLPPLPTQEPVPAASVPRADLDDDVSADDEPLEPDEPTTLPSPARLGFMPNLLLFLAAPVRAFGQVDDVPVRVGVRFGFLCAFAGIMGTALRTWFRGVTPWVATELPPTISATCYAQQMDAWNAGMHNYFTARIPISPILALLLVYGLAHVFYWMAAAMSEKPLDVDLPTVARNVGFALAPLALSGIFFFEFCFIWSLVLCIVALHQALKFSWWVCAAMTSVPLCMWLIVELVVQYRIVAPCMQVVL